MLEDADRNLGDESKGTLTKLLQVSEGIVKTAQAGGKLFFEKGSARPSPKDQSPEAVKKSAIAKAKKDNPKLTDAQAFVAAHKADPAAFAEEGDQS